jgi:hypothetical protein
MSMVLEKKGHYLAHQASQRIHWWSGKCLHALIEIIPALEEADPLWKRNEESLANIRLCKLTPEELQAKLQRYWNKPAWRQWLQRLFSSIEDQLTVWSYYQQCLVFREVQGTMQPPTGELVAAPSACSQRVLGKLGDWFSETENQFERYLTKQSASWLRKNFCMQLLVYQNNIEKKLAKRLKQELQKFPSCDREHIIQECQEAYRGVMRILHDYWFKWYHATYTQSVADVEKWTIVTIANTATISSARQVTRPVFKKRLKPVLSPLDVPEWISVTRKQIRKRLEQKEVPTSELVIPDLLTESLGKLLTMVRPHLQYHQQCVDDVFQNKVSYEEALQGLCDLQPRLLKFYRQGLLLFHPDHYQDLLVYHPLSLARCWNEIFLQYKQHVDTSLAELNNLQERLNHYINFISKFDQRAILADLRRTYDKLREEVAELSAARKAFRKEMQAREERLRAVFEECKARLESNVRADMQAREERLRAEEKARLAQLKADMQAQTNKQLQGLSLEISALTSQVNRLATLVPKKTDITSNNYTRNCEWGQY